MTAPTPPTPPDPRRWHEWYCAGCNRNHAVPETQVDRHGGRCPWCGEACTYAAGGGNRGPRLMVVDYVGVPGATPPDPAAMRAAKAGRG